MNELDPELYTVAWLAPLEFEAQAALNALDRRHEGTFPTAKGVDYVFRAGEAGGHNIVMASLPAGQLQSTGSVAALASQVKMLFPNIWFGLLVGVAAGLPHLSGSPPLDIRLGDVLVALPTEEYPGVVAYGLGKERGDDTFQLLRHGFSMAGTETIVRSAIGSIRLEAPDEKAVFLPHLSAIQGKDGSKRTFVDPGQEKDMYFQADEGGTESLVQRQRRPSSGRTRVWYGPLGSGDQIVRNAKRRDEFRDKYGFIGLDSGAAGVMNIIPVGVVRGVCSYADDHDYDEWQSYAAAMAAAYARAILAEILPKKPRVKRQLNVPGSHPIHEEESATGEGGLGSKTPCGLEDFQSGSLEKLS